MRRIFRLISRYLGDRSAIPTWTYLLLLIAGFLLIPLIAVTYFGREPVRERRITILAVNDVYRLDGVSENRLGGLHRLRTLRRWIERAAPNTLLLHAGDFLSPSLISNVFDGEQMIDVMNHLDGDGPAFDPRMFVTFGNHEFDESRCDNEPAPLNRRLDESNFLWLVSNLDFSDCPSMKTLLSHKNVRKDGVVLDIDGVKVGIFGIGLTPDKMSAPKYPRFGDPMVAARRSIEHLRRSGAELVVAVTHLPRNDDEELIREFAAKGLDLVVGGHDHTNMVLKDEAGQPRGYKADSDARSAWWIDVYLPNAGKPRIEARLVTLNEAIPPDVEVAKLAAFWFARASAAICAKRAKANNCLMDKIGRTQTKIELEELVNRSQETGIGDWLADLIMSKTDADVAIVNSGILGLNEDLAPGSDLLLKHIVDIFRFDDVVATRKFPAKLVCDALSHGFTTPGLGAWPHVGGVEIDIKSLQNGKNAATVRRFLKRPDVTCDSSAEIKVAAVPYLLCGGDGYPLKAANPNPKQECDKSIRANPFDDPVDKIRPSLLFSQIVESAIRLAGTAGIKPAVDGRLRLTGDAGSK